MSKRVLGSGISKLHSALLVAFAWLVACVISFEYVCVSFALLWNGNILNALENQDL